MSGPLDASDLDLVRLGEEALSPDIDASPCRDRYRLGRKLGEGAMGEVFEADDRVLGRRVALKRMRRWEDAVAAARFRREARTAARLSHAGIVAIHDVGEIAGVPFYTMELIEGPTLASKIGCDPREAARLVAQAARAIDEAHRAGIVHRDIKPSNVLLRPDGRVVVGDFGLARDVSVRSSLTGSERTIGTPDYMSPEQVLGRVHEVDARSDVYGLGATLYHLVAGCPPFGGESLGEAFARILEGRPRDPGEVRRCVPPRLSAIVLKAMSRDRGARYATAAELADDLDRFVEGRPVSARRPRRARAAIAVVAFLSLAAALAGARPRWSDAFAAVRADFRRSLARWSFSSLDPIEPIDPACAARVKELERQGAPPLVVAQARLLLDVGTRHFKGLDSVAPIPQGELCAEGCAAAGIVAEQTGDPREAERRYRQALALDPDFAVVWCRLGEVLVRAARAQAALDAADVGERRAPPEALYAFERIRAEACLALGRMDDAIRHLHGGDPAALGADGLLDVAAIRLAEGDFARAKEACDRVLSLMEEPQWIAMHARYLRACARGGRGRAGEGIDDLVVALGLARAWGCLWEGAPVAGDGFSRPERRGFISFSQFMSTGSIDADPLLASLRAHPRYEAEVRPLLDLASRP